MPHMTQLAACIRTAASSTRSRPGAMTRTQVRLGVTPCGIG